MVSRRTRYRRATGPSLGYSSTQHCRCDRGGQPEFHRPESGGHGGCRCDRRVADSHATVADTSQDCLESDVHFLKTHGSEGCRSVEMSDSHEQFKATAQLTNISGFKERETRTLMGKIYHQFREFVA